MVANAEMEMEHRFGDYRSEVRDDVETLIAVLRARHNTFVQITLAGNGVDVAVGFYVDGKARTVTRPSLGSALRAALEGATA
jgi:hypothetical protein